MLLLPPTQILEGLAGAGKEQHPSQVQIWPLTGELEKSTGPASSSALTPE